MEAMMKDDMYAEVVTVTPELADAWLSRNGKNRRIKADRVNQYAMQMQSGEWQLNGEGIILRKDGSLADGQHRLEAVKKAKMPVKMLVVYNAPCESSIYDLGANRSESDTLQVEGFDKRLSGKNSVSLAKLHYLMQDTRKWYGHKVPLYKIREFIDKYANTIIALDTGVFGNNNKRSGVNINTSPFRLACLYAIESGVSCETIRGFADIVRTGICFDQKKSSAVILRNDIIGRNASAKTDTARMKMVHQVERAISDYVSMTKRSVTYKNCDTPIYSSLDKFKEMV